MNTELTDKIFVKEIKHPCITKIKQTIADFGPYAAGILSAYQAAQSGIAFFAGIQFAHSKHPLIPSICFAKSSIASFSSAAIACGIYRYLHRPGVH